MGHDARESSVGDVCGKMKALNFDLFCLACGEAITLRVAAQTMSDRLYKHSALLVQDPRDEGKHRSLHKHLSTAERHPQHVALQVGCCQGRFNRQKVEQRRLKNKPAQSGSIPKIRVSQLSIETAPAGPCVSHDQQQLQAEGPTTSSKR